MAHTPIMEAYPEDLYDPSDPTDREQIDWRAGKQRQSSSAGAAAAAAAEQAASPGGAGGEQPAAVGEGQGSQPARQGSLAGEASVAGYAASAAASDQTFAAHAGEPGGGSSGGPRQLSVAAQLQKDAFLVFRALCKLSIRSSDAAPGSEVTTIRGKVRWEVVGDAGCGLRNPAGVWQHCSTARVCVSLLNLHLHPPCSPVSRPAAARCWRWSCSRCCWRTAGRCSARATALCLPSSSTCA